MEELPTLRLDGKVALVTGSTRGIGRELATGFARAGARVWVHGRRRNEAEQLADELGGRFVVADLGDAGWCASAGGDGHCGRVSAGCPGQQCRPRGNDADRCDGHGRV